MLKNGASLIEVSQILGHSSVSVTGDFYGIVGEEELQEISSGIWLDPVVGFRIF